MENTSSSKILLRGAIYGSIIGSVITAGVSSLSTSALSAADGVFGQYFINIVTSACGSADGVVTGFDSAPGNYGARICTSLQSMLDAKSIYVRSGKIGIGNSSPSLPLDVSGSIMARGTTSDIDANRNIWAQAFYDRNNGSYYIDPSGVSVVNTFAVKGDISADGIVQVGQSNATCNPSLGGALRFNTVNNCVEYCDKTSWSCVGAPVVSYSWISSAWSVCSLACGGGVANRTVICQRNDGITVADSFCSGAKPSITMSCNTTSCPSMYNTPTCWNPPTALQYGVLYSVADGSFYYKITGQTWQKYTGSPSGYSSTVYGACWRNEGEKIRINSITDLGNGNVQVNLTGWDAFFGDRFNWNLTIPKTIIN